MARIVCFSDSLALVRTMRQGISSREHSLFPLPGSQLSEELRRTVRKLAPDVIMIELTRALDNPHLFFFLRSDAATRNVPLIAVAANPELEPYAAALGADGFLCEPQPETIARTLDQHLPLQIPIYAPAPVASSIPLGAPARHPRPLRQADARAAAFAPLMALA